MVLRLLMLLLLPQLALTSTKLVCPSLGSEDDSVRLIGRDPVRRFTEVSGAVFSKNQVAPETGNPILYVITDGENNNWHEVGGGRIGVYDSGTGKRLTTLALTNQTIENYDWEALTLGSCGTFEGSCIYVGDVGDNVAINTSGRRNDRTREGKPYRPYRFIKIKEPDLMALPGFPEGNLDNTTIPNGDVEILPFDFLDATSPTDYADSEAIFLDHTGWGPGNSVGDIYMITKWGQNSPHRNRLFHFPIDAWQNGNSTTGVTFYPLYSPQTVGDYSDVEGSEFNSFQWTGADMTLDGTVLAISTNDASHLFLRCPGETVPDALTGSATSCPTFEHHTGGIETSAWTPDALQLLKIPEGPRPRMGWNVIEYNAGSSRTCPAFDGQSASATAATPLPTQSATTPVPATPPPSSGDASSSVAVSVNVEIELGTSDITAVPTEMETDSAGVPLGWATSAPTDEEEEGYPPIEYVGNNGDPADGFPLGLCQGDCDTDEDCAGDLVCFLRDSDDEDDEEIPGCSNPGGDNTGDDYCINPSATEGSTQEDEDDTPDDAPDDVPDDTPDDAPDDTEENSNGGIEDANGGLNIAISRAFFGW